MSFRAQVRGMVQRHCGGLAIAKPSSTVVYVISKYCVRYFRRYWTLLGECRGGGSTAQGPPGYLSRLSPVLVLGRIAEMGQKCPILSHLCVFGPKMGLKYGRRRPN